MTTQTRAQAGHGLGFEGLDEEVRADSLDVRGEIPHWLTGSLVRLSTAGLDVGGQPVRHWFDGLAMLHRFSFGAGTVGYANRWLETEARARARAGKLPGGGFATDPCRSIFKRFAAAFSPELTDNANVNVTRSGERFIAMTETPMPVEFDPATLRTLGHVAYADDLAGQVTTAHPHADPLNGELVNYVAHMSARSSYRIYAQAPGADSRRLLAEVPASRPAYMHSFAITERYVVLAEFPLVVNPLRLAGGGRSFIESYRWEPERGTSFVIVDRDSGKTRRIGGGPALFAFHHVNAFEDDATIVMDLCAYDDPSIIDRLYVDQLRDTARWGPTPTLRRLRVPLGGGTVTEERIVDEGIELPRIDYGRRNGRPYRFAYGVGWTGDGLFDQLVKVDVGEGSARTWRQQGTYPGEPVFVRDPDGEGEDEGVVLSVILDPAAGRSVLVVLDAETLTERARVGAPHAIPFGFHGQFFGEPA